MKLYSTNFVLESFSIDIISHLLNRLVNMSHLMIYNLLLELLNELATAVISDFPFGVSEPLTKPVSVCCNG